MSPVNCGSHADYQNFVFENLRKYYPNPDSIAKSTWDIIDRFWNLDLSFTDALLKPKYSVYGILRIRILLRMKSFLPDFNIKKVLLDSVHNAMPYYRYFKRAEITPFTDLNGKGGRPPVYKNDFTIDNDGVPICQAGCRMRRDGTEAAKGRTKFKCPKMNRKNGTLTCICDNPCSDAKYGRTVHLIMNDNPRLFNIPPRNSIEWKLEYNGRTSEERSNKREKYVLFLCSFFVP